MISPLAVLLLGGYQVWECQHEILGRGVHGSAAPSLLFLNLYAHIILKILSSDFTWTGDAISCIAIFTCTGIATFIVFTICIGMTVVAFIRHTLIIICIHKPLITVTVTGICVLVKLDHILSSLIINHDLRLAVSWLVYRGRLSIKSLYLNKKNSPNPRAASKYKVSMNSHWTRNWFWPLQRPGWVNLTELPLARL